MYIFPEGSLEPDDEKKFPVIDSVNEFFEDKIHKVLLLLGNAGSGKSLLGHHIQRAELKKGKIERIPLFISLTSVENPTKQLLIKYLTKQLCLNIKEARYVMNNYPLLLILDGFDQLSPKYQKNLYRCNLFGTLPNLKIIISCRTSSLNHMSGKMNHREYFAPNGENGYEFDKLEQLVIRPFNQAHIEQYISKFVIKQSTEWSVEKYLEVIKHERLTDLSNPFLLYVGLDCLSTIVKGKEKGGITRFDLYMSFINN